MSYRFENLEVWKLSRIFTNTIYSVTKNFPKEEIFAMTNQIRRAALSITLNIAEGSDRKSDVEFIRFLRIAYGSLQEVVAASYVVLDQHYLTQEQFTGIYESSHLLGRKLNALVQSLKNTAGSQQ
jgi:four helix bundle protein